MKKTAIAFAVALASLATVAQAAPQPQTWYAGAKIGWSKYYKPTLSNTLQSSFNDHSPKKNDLGGGVFLGYQANRYVAFEIGYDWLGKLKYRHQSAGVAEPSASISGTELSAKFSYPISNKLDIYTRLGGFIWNDHFRAPNISEKDSGLSPLVAVGAEYAITPALSTRLDYQWVSKVGDFNSVNVRPNNSLLTLGLVYHFGQQEKVAPPAPVIPVKPVVTAKKVVPAAKSSETILFDFNSSKLNSQSQAKLSNLAHNLKKSVEKHQQFNVSVVGHSDRIGNTQAKRTVSIDRAKAVENYLISQGIPANEIAIQGVGSTQSVTGNKCDNLTSNQLKTCLAPDRRVVITVDNSAQ